MFIIVIKYEIVFICNVHFGAIANYKNGPFLLTEENYERSVYYNFLFSVSSFEHFRHILGHIVISKLTDIDQAHQATTFCMQLTLFHMYTCVMH